MNGNNPYSYGYGPNAGPPPQPPPYATGPSQNPYHPQYQQQQHQHQQQATHYGHQGGQSEYRPQLSQGGPSSHQPYAVPTRPPGQFPPPTSLNQHSPYHGGNAGYSTSGPPPQMQTSSNTMPPFPNTQVLSNQHAQPYAPGPSQPYLQPSPLSRPPQQPYKPPYSRPPPSPSMSQYSQDAPYSPHVPQPLSASDAGSGDSEDAAMRAYIARSLSRPPPPTISGPPPTSAPRFGYNSNDRPIEARGHFDGASSTSNGFSSGSAFARPPPPMTANGSGVDRRSEAEKAASAWKERQNTSRPLTNGPQTYSSASHYQRSHIPIDTTLRPPPPSGNHFDYNVAVRPPLPSLPPGAGTSHYPSQPPQNTNAGRNKVRPPSVTVRPTQSSALPPRPHWSEQDAGAAFPHSLDPAATSRRLPGPPQRGIGLSRGSPPRGKRRWGSGSGRPTDGRSRSPRPRRPSRSRTPTPDPLQEVFLAGLDPDITPDQLHEMIDKLCSESDLTTADEVLLLRDRQTRTLNGSAIATFPRIADAIRFVNANGPRIEGVERFFGLRDAGGDEMNKEEKQKRKPIRLTHGGNVGDDDEAKEEKVQDVSHTEDVASTERTEEGCETGDLKPASNAESTETLGKSEPAKSTGESHQVDLTQPPVLTSNGSPLDDTVSTAAHETGDVSDAGNAAKDGPPPEGEGKALAEGRPGEEETQPVEAPTTDPQGGAVKESLDELVQTNVAETGSNITPVALPEPPEVASAESERMEEVNSSTLSSAPVSTTLAAPLLDDTGEKKPSQLLSSKKVALNIANWNKKQEELHRSLPSTTTSSILGSVAEDEPPSDGPDATAPIASEDIPEDTPPPDVDIDYFSDRTALCCYLCGRKFKTLQVLERHPRESKLHTANLGEEEKRRSGGEALRKAKISASTGVVGGGSMKRKAGPSGFVPVPGTSSGTPSGDVSSSEGKYRDRALERRVAFGPEVSAPTSNKKVKSSRSFEGPTPASPPVPSSRALDEKIGEDNVGNKMLQMMGWSEGDVLGSTGEGLGRPIEAVMYAKGAGLGAAGVVVGGGGGEKTVGWKARLDQARDGRMTRYEEANKGE